MNEVQQVLLYISETLNNWSETKRSTAPLMFSQCVVCGGKEMDQKKKPDNSS